MELSDSISIGPLTIPLILIISVIIAAAAYLAGSIRLKDDKENRKIFSDLLFSPILPFLISWKLSLLFTDGLDVLKNPLLLLYSQGGWINILIAVFIACLWLTYRWKKAQPANIVNRSMIRALLTILVLSLCTSGYALLTAEKGEDRFNLPIAEFSEKDGTLWDISDARGSIVVLNFWASWCPPCRAEMPMLERLQTNPGFKNVVFYAVNASGTEKNPEDGLEWMNSNSIDLPLLFDTSSQGMSLYEISGLPTTIIIDAQGRIVDRKTGAVSRSWLLAAVRKAK
ncbi:MAG: TlpA family protein disulfide reductase [Spirochaetaceae bacterium]|nr:TlpA family protein disulfide reductase [Spirochaetaceae bacterium]